MCNQLFSGAKNASYHFTVLEPISRVSIFFKLQVFHAELSGVQASRADESEAWQPSPKVTRSY